MQENLSFVFLIEFPVIFVLVELNVPRDQKTRDKPFGGCDVSLSKCLHFLSRKCGFLLSKKVRVGPKE